MQRISFRILVSGLALGSLSVSTASAAGERPNIIFILADDQRSDELGCAGDSILHTPNIDQLAKQGVRFPNMFVTTPICMCSRATILTGLTMQTHQWMPTAEDCRLVDETMLKSSFPYLLRQAGYSTAQFGKNHVRFTCGTKQAHDVMYDQWEVIHRDPYFKKMPDGSLRHTAELVGDRSCDFLREQNSENPFFLYVSFNIAHAEDNDHRPGIGQFPWPKAVDGLYEDVEMPPPHLNDPAIYNAMPDFLKESVNRTRWFWRWDTPEKYQINMRARYRMITGMDRVIGRVLDTLKEQGLSDNTIILYSADNGLYRGNRRFAGKWSHFEESLRVPLIVCDPRAPKNRRGVTDRSMVLNLDLPSTMLNMAGVRIPATYQGRSLEPLLRGETPANWRTDFFCQHFQLGTIIPEWSGVRSERYLYACYTLQTPAYEFLFDLQRDPDELNNLAESSEHRGILNDLRNRRLQYLTEYTQARSAVRPEEEPQPVPSASVRKPVTEKIYAGGEAIFSGKDYLKLGDTPALGVEDSYTWHFQVQIEPDCAPGAVLMGNRTTPGRSGLNFVKITVDRGAQFFSGSPAKNCTLKAVLPKGRWIDVKLEKTGEAVTLYVDGKAVASGAVRFPLSAMPCYLGGDPNYGEFARCSIRNALMEEK